MTLEETVDKFVKHPSLITNGAPSLAKRWGIDLDVVYQARGVAKDIIKNKEEFGTEYNPSDVAFTTPCQNFINGIEDDIYKYVSDKIKKAETKLPKILIFDIESSPSITYSFGRFQVNIGIDQVIQDPIFLTWSAKWLYSSEILSDKITQEEVLAADDYRIVKSLWDLVDEADVVVAHYGDGFDIPMLNYRAIIHGLKPFSSIKSIDTKKVASMSFKFPSNKLDAIAGYFGVGNKIKTDFDLWKRCLNGDEDAITEMDIYCNQDVKILEDVYLRLRPYVRSHPNLGVYNETEEAQCSMCGSTDLVKEGYYFTNTAKYEQYRCSCGALSRGRINLLTKDKKKTLLTSIPR